MKKRFAIIFQPLLMLGATAVMAGDGDEGALILQKDSSPQMTNQNEVLRDIQGPLPTSGFPPYLMEALTVLVVLLLLALLAYYFKKRKKTQPRVTPPWEIALLQLAEARKLMRVEKNLLYMDEAAQILRRYIEARFSIRSTRQTTREFFAGLQGAGHPSLLQYCQELRACLEQADLAKFAHLAADERHMHQMEEAVQTFINSTRPTTSAEGDRS